MSIDRLIVVAGPKAVGKSFLINLLQMQKLPHLAEKIKLGDPMSWRYMSAFEFENPVKQSEVKNTALARLFLHYEITRPWDRKYQYGFIEDTPLRVLRHAKNVTILTLWAPPHILLNRFLERNKRFSSTIVWLQQLFHHGIRFSNLENDFRPLYRDHKEIDRLYLNWLEFCHIIGSNSHWVIDSSDDQFSSSYLVEPDEWAYQFDSWQKTRSHIQ